MVPRLLVQAVRRARGPIHAGLGNMEVCISRGKTGMSQKLFDIKHICASFKRMSSKAVTKRVYCPGRSDSCLFLVYIKHVFHPSGRKISLVPSAGKQVMIWT